MAWLGHSFCLGRLALARHERTAHEWHHTEEALELPLIVALDDRGLLLLSGLNRAVLLREALKPVSCWPALLRLVVCFSRHFCKSNITIQLLISKITTCQSASSSCIASGALLASKARPVASSLAITTNAGTGRSLSTVAPSTSIIKLLSRAVL